MSVATMEECAALVRALPAHQDINEHVGRRLRRRRKLFGWTLQTLAEATGLQYQQIHKYECGINRVSAGRLFALAVALQTPIDYFFVGLPGAAELTTAQAVHTEPPEVRDLIHAYYALPEGARSKFVELAKCFEPVQAA
ncbi:MAG: helix-turn-helix domain-containing protein [Hyphomonadaceae bacterium]